MCVGRLPRALHVQPPRPPAARPPAAPTSTSSTTTSASGTGLLGMMDDGWPVLATLHHPITVDRDLDLAHAHQRVAALHAAPLVRLPRHADEGGAARSRASSRCRSRASATSSRRWACRADRLHIVPVGVDPEIFHPMPEVARVPGRLMTTTSSDVPMKGLVPLLEALAKVRTERARRPPGDHRQAQGQEHDPRRSSSASGSSDAVRVRVGRDHRAHRRALRRGRGRGRAVALRGLLAPRDRGHGVRRAARRHHRRRAARGGRHRRRDRAAGAARTTPTRSRAMLLRRAGRRRPARPHRRRGARPGPRPLHLAGHRGRHGRELPRAARRARPGADRTGPEPEPCSPSTSTASTCAPATACSTWAAAAGATRSRRCGAARRSSRSTTTPAELKDVRAIARRDDRGRRGPRRRARRRGQRRRAAPAVPRRQLRPRSSRRRCSSTSGTTTAPIAELVRVLRPGGRIAVTVPTRFPERVCWAIDYQLPRHARWSRAHLPPARARAEARAGRALAARVSTTRTRCTRRTGGCGARSALDNTGGVAGAPLPRLPRVPDRTPAALGRRARPRR